MRYKKLGNSDVFVPAIGQGTMGIGGYFTKCFGNEDFYINSLKEGIFRGMTFIDTAENYAEGHTEELVGEAIKDCRDKVFIATKVSPEHLSYNDVILSAESSLKRLQIDYIDLYQIHWPNPSIPMEETIFGMLQLLKEVKIKHIGVCNFTLKQLKQAQLLSDNNISSIQVEYNLIDRTIEDDILLYCEKNKISIIAYSPLSYNGSELLSFLSNKYEKTEAQIVLNWLISKSSVVVIPKAVQNRHIIENSTSSDFDLINEDIDLISNSFRNQWIYVLTDKIIADRRNIDKFVPSVYALSKEIDESMKPVKISKNGNNYNLIEGRLRYWAWVIAHDNKPSYIKAIIK